jgi:hypothetical protein
VTHFHNQKIKLKDVNNEDYLEVKKYLSCQAWWLMPVIPALGRLRQEDHEFKASLGYLEILRETLSQKKKKKSVFLLKKAGKFSLLLGKYHSDYIS